MPSGMDIFSLRPRNRFGQTQTFISLGKTKKGLRFKIHPVINSGVRGVLIEWLDHQIQIIKSPLDDYETLWPRKLSERQKKLVSGLMFVSEDDLIKRVFKNRFDVDIRIDEKACALDLAQSLGNYKGWEFKTGFNGEDVPDYDGYDSKNSIEKLLGFDPKIVNPNTSLKSLIESDTDDRRYCITPEELAYSGWASEHIDPSELLGFVNIDGDSEFFELSRETRLLRDRTRDTKLFFLSYKEEYRNKGQVFLESVYGELASRREKTHTVINAYINHRLVEDNLRLVDIVYYSMNNQGRGVRYTLGLTHLKVEEAFSIIVEKMTDMDLEGTV